MLKFWRIGFIAIINGQNDMRIGIDCRQFYDAHRNKGAGIERYIYHLVRALLKQDQLNDYVLFFHSDLSPETIHKVRLTHSRVKIVKFFPTTSLFPLWDSHWRFSRILKKEKLDLAVFPANTMPLFYARPSLLVVHDVAIYKHPEWFPERQWFSTKIVVPASLRKARTIVTVSKNTKEDLLQTFKLPANKIKVIYPGVIVKEGYLEAEVRKVRLKFDVQGDYALFVGTIEPRKNILNLVKAFSNYIFENEESAISLVLAGVRGWKFQPIFQILQEINGRLAGSRIKYIGQVSNRERNILIKNSRLFVFPSYYEGFGFPILEAMSLGAPVITGNNSSLKEIASGAAYLVDPDSPNEIRRAIKQVLTDKYLRQQLIRQGRERAQGFIWAKTAAEFKKLFV